MLLSEIEQNVVPNYVKCAAEIVLDAKGFINLAEKLSNKCFYENGFLELKQFLIDNNKDRLFSTVANEVRDMMVRCSYLDLMLAYIESSRMVSCFRAKLSRSLDGLYCTEQDVRNTLPGFKKFFANKSFLSCCIEDAGYAKFIVSAYGKYFLSSKRDIVHMIKAKGTEIEGNDSNAISLVALKSTNEIDKNPSFDFQEDVKNINDASFVLYASSHKKNHEVYYDLVSAYKQHVCENKLESLAGKIRNAFYPVGIVVNVNPLTFLQRGTFFPSISYNNNINLSTAYQLETYKKRLLITNILFKFINTRLTVEDISELYKKMLNIEYSYANSKNIGKIFDSDLSQDNEINQNRLMTVIHGLISLKRLLVYCEKHNISLEDIPINIFRTSLYYKRFLTLEECLRAYEYTSALAEVQIPEVESNLLSNDATYDWLISELSKCNLSVTLKKFISPSANNRLDIVKSFMNKENVELVNKWYGVLSKEIADCDNYIKGKYGRVTDARYDIGESQDIEALTKLQIVFTQCGITYDSFVEDKTDFFGFVDGSYIINHLILAIISQLTLNMNILVNSSEYEKLDAINLGTVKKIPTMITSYEDLIELGQNVQGGIDIGISVEEAEMLDEGYLERITNLYSLAYNKFPLKNLVSDSNEFINNIVTEYMNLGIEFRNITSITPFYQNVGAMIYNSQPIELSPEFIAFKTTCTVKHGYLFRGSHPVLYRGFYVHECGKYVDTNGQAFKLPDDFRKFIGGF